MCTVQKANVIWCLAVVFCERAYVFVMFSSFGCLLAFKSHRDEEIFLTFSFDRPTQINLLLISLQLLEPSCLLKIISTHTPEASLVHGERRRRRVYYETMHNDLWHVQVLFCLVAQLLSVEKKEKISEILLWKESSWWCPQIWLLFSLLLSTYWRKKKEYLLSFLILWNLIDIKDRSEDEQHVTRQNSKLQTWNFHTLWSMQWKIK